MKQNKRVLSVFLALVMLLTLLPLPMAGAAGTAGSAGAGAGTAAPGTEALSSGACIGAEGSAGVALSAGAGAWSRSLLLGVDTKLMYEYTAKTARRISPERMRTTRFPLIINLL